MTDPLGVILAAGLAERMGVPKQLLPYRDGTVLGSVITAALTSQLSEIVVVIGSYEEEVRDGVDLTGVHVVVNPEPERGNLSSLLAAADSTGNGPLLLLMGDMPGLTAATIDAHLAAMRDDPAWLRTTTYTDGVGHPFMLSATLVSELGALAGPKPLWRLTQDERARTLVVDFEMPVDVDTPADYTELLARDAGEEHS